MRGTRSTQLRGVERSTGDSERIAKQNVSYVVQRRKNPRRDKETGRENKLRYVVRSRGVSGETNFTRSNHQERVLGHQVRVVSVERWQSGRGENAKSGGIQTTFLLLALSVKDIYPVGATIGLKEQK